MSSIFVFPGQGSQSVGMAKDLFDEYAVAREVFDAVDAALEEPGAKRLSEIIFDGPIEELTLTANVQPAIMAVSIAMLRVWMNKNNISRITPEISPFVAGHSLGEYTALCATGAISLEDTARLLRLRGDAMQRAVPVGHGAMAVIMGMDISDVQNICKIAEQKSENSVCDVANDNAPGQIVISGSKSAIEIAMELAKEQGAKRAMLLPLSVPPHSRLMAPVAIEMETALNNIDIKTPDVPLISNKTCAPISDVKEIKDALVYQITHGVRWRETILALPALGVNETIEVGPGNILTGLTGRIASEITAKKLEI